MRDREVVATIDGDGGGALAGGDRVLYAGANATGALTAYRQTGVSPTVTRQPASVAVELDSAQATASVAFTAAADGTPAPTVRWQSRAPGATAWRDVAGATDATLTVAAGAAQSGTRYRAVFENAAGRIASAAATLSATVRPPGAPPSSPPSSPPADSGGGTGGGSASLAPVVLVKPSVAVPRGSRARLNANRTATIATLRCAAQACRITVPRTVKVRIGGVSYRVGVSAPRTLRAGALGSVRVRLPRKAAAALRGRTATLKLEVAIRAGTQRISRTVRVKLRRWP